MKQLLLLVCSLFCFLCLQAQVSLDPTQIVVAEVSPDSAQVIGYARVKNNSDETRTYRWVRTIRSLSPDWETAVCDTNRCYLPNIDSMELELAPQLEANLNVYVYPNGKTGSSVVEVKITDINNPAFAASAVYYFNTTPSKVKNRDAYRHLKIYPNPTQDILQITDNNITRKIVVFSLAGRKVQSFSYTPGDQYHLNHLPRGSYLIQLQDANGQAVVTRLLNKL